MEGVISRWPRGLLKEVVLSLLAAITRRRNEFIIVKDKSEPLEASMKQLHCQVQQHKWQFDDFVPQQQQQLNDFKFKDLAIFKKAIDRLDQLMEELQSTHAKLEGIPRHSTEYFNIHDCDQNLASKRIPDPFPDDYAHSDFNDKDVDILISKTGDMPDIQAISKLIDITKERLNKYKPQTDKDNSCNENILIDSVGNIDGCRQGVKASLTCNSQSIQHKPVS